MTFNIGFEANSGAQATEYIVQRRTGCTLIFGSIGVSHFAALTKSQPKKTVMSSHVARLAGCTLAFGLAEDLKRLEIELAPHALARGMPRYASTGLSSEAIQWLCVGQRGQSADAMFFVLTGVNPGDIATHRLNAHPHDPDDLSRCRRLLEAVPGLIEHLPCMADVSPTWARLHEQWLTLCTLMDEEVPNWRTASGAAPKTYALMKRCTHPSDDCDHDQVRGRDRRLGGPS